MTKSEIVCHESLSSSNSKSPSQGQEEDNNKYQEKEEEEDQEEHHKGRIVLSKQPDSEASTSSSRKKHHHKVEDEEDNDGFRTPTSLDHRIPAAKQCPPAPRKLPKPSLKRKSSSSSSSSSSSHSSLFSCRSDPLDLSKEVELLFPATQHNQLLCDSDQNIKKVRRERSPCDV